MFPKGSDRKGAVITLSPSLDNTNPHHKCTTTQRAGILEPINFEPRGEGGKAGLSPEQLGKFNLISWVLIFRKCLTKNLQIISKSVFVFIYTEKGKQKRKKKKEKQTAKNVNQMSFCSQGQTNFLRGIENIFLWNLRQEKCWGRAGRYT